jgi:hypothetical protein
MARQTPNAIQEPFRQPDPEARRCEFPGCPDNGIFPAPQARDRLNDYYWFCLEHVRSYNAAWNYYAGMSEDEVEHHRRTDTVWQRPSWPFGGPSSKHERQIEDALRKEFTGVFDDGPRPCRPTRPQSEQEKALAVLDLDVDADAVQIKSRYIKLVKQLHPDANGGNPEAEERLKVVNHAYTALKNGSA